MAQNIYTTQFATKAEVNSEISQTADSITSTVAATYETKQNATTQYTTINQNINEVNIEVGKKYNTSDFTNAKITAKINDGTSNVKIDADKIDLSGKTINLTSDNIAIQSNNFNVDKYGNMTCNNGTFVGGNVNLTDNGLGAYEGKLKIQGNTFINGQYSSGIVIRKIGSSQTSTSANSIFLIMYENEPEFIMEGSRQRILDVSNDGIQGLFDNEVAFNVDGLNRQADFSGIRMCYIDGGVTTPQVIQTSKAEEKKNFEKLKKGLDIVKDTDIYKYNLKQQKDGEKKHIGFVIGKDFKYSQEITSGNNEGVDLYSMVAVAYKAIQEQQEIIEELQKEIKLLKGEKDE